MIYVQVRRRVRAPGCRAREYVSGNNCKMKRRRTPCQEPAARTPLTLHRSRSTPVSVPAHVGRNTPTQRHLSEGVTHPGETRNLPALLAAAAANPAVSDRAMRVYTVVVVLDQEVSAALIAATLPALTEAQAGRLLGDLVSAGLLRKRLRVVAYLDGKRVRRGAYSLVGGAR